MPTRTLATSKSRSSARAGPLRVSGDEGSEVDVLRCVSTFVRAAELGSIGQAAAALETDIEDVSESIHELEQHIGTRLLHRTAAGLTLTDEGQRFLQDTKGSVEKLLLVVKSTRAKRVKPHLK
jgi:DNA-binding transcriptional LysR family regulator